MDLTRIAKAVEAEDRDREGRKPEPRMGKIIQPKNRAPAPIQITAEQLLRESLEFKESTAVAPQQTVATEAEFAEYRLRKRKEFEDSLRRQRHHVGAWLRYAAWEAGQRDWRRARSVFERCLEVDYRVVAVWLRYADMEMQHRFIAHARNVLDRAVTLLPRLSQLWYKYVYMEEMLGDVSAVRAIFSRWMAFQPEESAWLAFIRFELRHGQYEQARAVHQQLSVAHHRASSYIRHAKFEERHGQLQLARAVFELGVKELKESRSRTEEQKAEEEELLLLAYAEFEERQREYERARAIFRYALDRVKRSTVSSLFERYARFEKQHGGREEVETVVLAKRRLQYEQQLSDNAHNYDAYFDYLQLEQSMPAVSASAVRALFERAVAAVPPVLSKRAWKRYVYLWLHFAVWEELDMRDAGRATAVYEKALALLQPLSFTFAKLWILYAEFCLRRRDLPAARKVYGAAIARSGKDSVFLSYLQTELSLGEIDRCRRIYESWLQRAPQRADVWCAYGEMEERLEEQERARRIMDLGLAQLAIDRPERLWKGYIDMEIRWMRRQQEPELRTAACDRVRLLFDRLLQQTQHVKVWIAYAQFEATEKQWKRTRELFTRADAHYQQRCKEAEAAAQQQQADDVDPQLSWQRQREREAVREERVLLLSSWAEYEQLYGSRAEQDAVASRQPGRITRRRQRRDAAGRLLGGWEEQADFVFPDEAAAQQTAGLRILEAAKRWKQQQERDKRRQLDTAQRELDGNGDDEPEAGGQQPAAGTAGDGSSSSSRSANSSSLAADERRAADA